jgi:hypothetical protein
VHEILGDLEEVEKITLLARVFWRFFLLTIVNNKHRGWYERLVSSQTDQQNKTAVYLVRQQLLMSYKS